jgi:hypothetical protein
MQIKVKKNIAPASAPQKNMQRSPTDRWTPVLGKRFTPVSDEFLRLYGQLYPPITNGEAMFIIQLLSFKWDEKMPRPGFKTIAKRMGISDTQARSYARNLEKNNYLGRIKRVGQTNRFDLTPLFKVLEHELAELAKQKEQEEDEE